ncbi:MAG: 1,6-anhydro-N-acetylmuramyl-L-alanine amidase AmpD [Gammaproteobacteria bacterium]|nr:1,6-anhydro-N-acetylmuramyl-L-alanine amidase AmpD [Gammaproteobacteria bacterium]
MNVDAASGRLDAARQVPSPNWDARPGDVPIDLIIVHGISLPPGVFGGPWIDAFFTNALDAGAHPYFREIKGLRVSAHLLVRRDGELVQYVPFHGRAWHAGESRYEGRSRCNDFSIGVELEGVDDVAYEEAQYRVLAEVIHALAAAYPAIAPDRVVGHCDVAPGRKSDPGPAFDWARLRRLLGPPLAT